jgi:hypothetical protein
MRESPWLEPCGYGVRQIDERGRSFTTESEWIGGAMEKVEGGNVALLTCSVT